MTGNDVTNGKDKSRKKFRKYITKLIAAETDQNEVELEKFIEEEIKND